MTKPYILIIGIDKRFQHAFSYGEDDLPRVADLMLLDEGDVRFALEECGRCDTDTCILIDTRIGDEP